MNTRQLIIGALLLGLLGLPAMAAQNVDKRVTIGVVFDGTNQPYSGFFAEVKAEIIALAGDDFDIVFPNEFAITADWSTTGIDAALSRLLAEPRVDVVLAFGQLASDRAARIGVPAKPVIAPFIIDPQLQGIAVANNASGVRNFNYVSAFDSIARDLELFSAMVKADRIVLGMQRSAMQAIPDFDRTIAAIGQDLGLTIHVVPADTNAGEFLDALPADTEAVYLTRLFRFDEAEMKALADGLIVRKLPSLTMGGRTKVALGFLASYAADTDYPRLARRIALNLQRILLGEDAGTLKVSFTQGRQLTINMATCRAVGYSPNWEYLAEADVLNGAPETSRRYDLVSAMRSAVEANPQVEMALHAVAAGEEDIAIARSTYLPQLDVSATGLMIDGDRAAAAMGSNPEKQLVGKASFRQLLYSEPANASLDIQNKLLETKTAELESVKLDVALEAGVAYLNVLRARAVETIWRDHLRLTRSNLELARVREAVGAGGRIDVYRWESQLAMAKNDLNRAGRDRSLAEMQFNRVLNRPLEESFATVDDAAAVELLMPREMQIIALADTPQRFALLRDYLVQAGLAGSPELVALDAAIAAQTRALQSAEAAFWSPTLALQGSLEQRMYEGGAGQDGFNVDLGPLTGLVDIDFPVKPDSTNWNLALNASFNLYDGRGKSSRVRKATEELAIIRTQRAHLQEQLAQAIRSTAQSAGSAWTSIGLARQAAEAAHKGLDLVTDAYSRGVVDILTLLDAQNTALSADQLSANAVYNFAIELLRTERAAGTFVAFMDDTAWNEWLAGFRNHLQAAGASR